MLKRLAITAAGLLFGLCFSALAQTQLPDALGFCPPPATISACTNAPGNPYSGIGGESVSVPTNQIGMEANVSNAISNVPWYLILAIPNYSGSAPVLSSISGNCVNASSNPAPCSEAGSAADAPTAWSSSSQGDLYAVAETAVAGVSNPNGSLSFVNLTGANEQDALCGSASCGAPGSFAVFVYTFSPNALNDNTPYVLNFASALPNGTWLAGNDGGNNQFSTTNTFAGLVNGPDNCTGNTCTIQPFGSPVPEPSSVVLLGTMILGAATLLKKKAQARQ